ncbi:MAG TPA: isoprenylcysteine carboxylmethyltransferase family protein [Nitrospirota bacterium]|nr:isoprenylcysteine carboxylmethyltransferase family protein [Nitrospirota bacterium]
MFLRALLAFLLLPGAVAFILPPVLASFDPWRACGLRWGALVMLLGIVLLVWCVRDFYVSGKGTLAPWDPPKKLVVVGLYRHMRNPMYVGVLTLVMGWSLLFTSPILLCYTVVLAIGFHIRVLTHEEPWLESRFGNEWRQYRSAVNRWLPRLAPWRGGH